MRKARGKNLQRIFAPVELPSADERFGLGYEPKKGDKESSGKKREAIGPYRGEGVGV